MPTVLNRYATPFITGLFIVSLVSGLALFFHVGPSGFHGMHEWLSLLLILPFVLHLWKNWRALLTYFKRAPMPVALAVSLILSMPFLMSSGTGPAGGPPPFAFSHQILTNSAREVAPLLGITVEDLADRLAKAGIVVEPDRPLAEMIAASGQPEMRAVAAMLSPAS